MYPARRPVCSPAVQFGQELLPADDGLHDDSRPIKTSSPCNCWVACTLNVMIRPSISATVAVHVTSEPTALGFV